MRVLLLGPSCPVLEDFIVGCGDEVRRVEDPLPAFSESTDKYDFAVSYGYRHIIGKDWIAAMLNRIVNLHISLLPWNRGADPNLWSYLDDTPKGVSIHVVDAGVDTGPLLVQRRVNSEPGDTLATSYARLKTAVETLFVERWRDIRAGKVAPVLQPGGGSYHRTRDRDRVAHLLTRGWETPVADLVENYRTLEERRSV